MIYSLYESGNSERLTAQIQDDICYLHLGIKKWVTLLVNNPA